MSEVTATPATANVPVVNLGTTNLKTHDTDNPDTGTEAMSPAQKAEMLLYSTAFKLDAFAALEVECDLGPTDTLMLRLLADRMRREHCANCLPILAGC